MSLMSSIPAQAQETRQFRFRVKYAPHVLNLFEVLNRRPDMCVTIEDVQPDNAGLFLGQVVSGRLQAASIRLAREYLRECPGFLVFHSLVYQ
jgi:hypothetical protein